MIIIIALIAFLCTSMTTNFACSCREKRAEKQKKSQESVQSPAQHISEVPLESKASTLPLDELQTRSADGRVVNFRHNVFVDGDLVVGDGKKLHTSTITAGNGNSTTMVMNDLAVTPCKNLLSNTIAPISTITWSDGTVQNTIDPNGTTYFAGNVGISPDTTLFANEIAPATATIRECSSNSFVASCGASATGTTCFNGNVGIRPVSYRNQHRTNETNSLLVNTIAPIAIDDEGNAMQDPAGTTSFLGNVTIGDNKTLTVNGTTIINSTLTIAPNAKVLSNSISPAEGATLNLNGTVVIPEFLAVDSISSYADNILTINNDLAVAESKTLIAKTIKSTNDVLYVGNSIKIDSGHTVGQTSPIRLQPESVTPVLACSFNNNAATVFDANLATGAWVNLKIHGVGQGHDNQQASIFFDFFTEATVYVGPGATFQNALLSNAVIRYGHNFPYRLQRIDITFSSPSSNSVLINITPHYEQTAQFTLDGIDAVIFYDAIGSNIATINNSF